jgi:hypothetical protein
VWLRTYFAVFSFSGFHMRESLSVVLNKIEQWKAKAQNEQEYAMKSTMVEFLKKIDINYLVLSVIELGEKDIGMEKSVADLNEQAGFLQYEALKTIDKKDALITNLRYSDNPMYFDPKSEEYRLLKLNMEKRFKKEADGEYGRNNRRERKISAQNAMQACVRAIGDQVKACQTMAMEVDIYQRYENRDRAKEDALKSLQHQQALCLEAQQANERQQKQLKLIEAQLKAGGSIEELVPLASGIGAGIASKMYLPPGQLAEGS